MIRNRAKLAQFQARQLKKEKISYRQALALYEALHREAVSLKAIHSKNIWDGIEVDLRMARLIHQMKDV